MKKIFLLIFAFWAVSRGVFAEDLLIKKKAEEIYEKCKNSVYQNAVLEENDVIKEQKIRQCLKNDIINLSQNFIAKDEINQLEENINNVEILSGEIYRILIFCTANEDMTWCKDRYRQENSLGKLILEKNVTAQVYNILINILESKSGDFSF